MRALFEYVDADGDGSLSLAEFIEPLCQHCLARHPKLAVVGDLSMYLAKVLELIRLIRIFSILLKIC